ncbi:hypothetical protein HanPSC8_Chr03g0125621 [Helianthus annuus]|nr:hypothetical protein HanPSC8_Chr03g0125621 [Helianthus annuus]
MKRLPYVSGLCFENTTSSRPMHHLRFWFSASYRVIGRSPKKAGLLGWKNIDFHPLQCCWRPVLKSSDKDPYLKPI